MGQQAIVREAHGGALDVQPKRRRERADREKRLEDLVGRVLVAMRERNATVADAAPGRIGSARDNDHDGGSVSALEGRGQPGMVSACLAAMSAPNRTGIGLISSGTVESAPHAASR